MTDPAPAHGPAPAHDSARIRDDRTLTVLSTSDVAGIDITPADVLAAVESAYRTLAAGRSDNPRKLTV